jgi:hypothetical protein
MATKGKAHWADALADELSAARLAASAATEAERAAERARQRGVAARIGEWWPAFVTEVRQATEVLRAVEPDLHLIVGEARIELLVPPTIGRPGRTGLIFLLTADGDVIVSPRWNGSGQDTSAALTLTGERVTPDPAAVVQSALEPFIRRLTTPVQRRTA